MPVQALLPLIPAAIQGFTALRQNQMAKDVKKSNYIPPSITQAEKRTRAMADTTQLPGQDQIEEKIDRQSSNATSAVRRSANDSASVMEAVQEQDAVTKTVMGDIQKSLADFKFSNEQSLNRVLQTKAQYEADNQRAYEGAKSALKGASQQNLFNAASNAATAGMFLGQDGNQTQEEPPVTPMNQDGPGYFWKKYKSVTPRIFG